MLVLTFRFLLYFINNLLSQVIEEFSKECYKTETKLITQANQDRGNQYNEPIRIQSKYMELAPDMGKCAQARHSWFWFCLSNRAY